MALTPEALISRVQVNIPFPFLGQGYLELFLDRGLNPEIGLDANSLSNFQRRDFQRMARAFHQTRRRLTLHAPFQDLLPGALDELILYSSRRRLGQAFRLLPVFKPVTIVCHLGFEAKLYQGDRGNWLERSAATWKEFAALAATHGVTVMLENVYEPDPDLFVELLTLVNAPNLQVCLDVGHLQAFGGGDFDHWLHTLWPVIGQPDPAHRPESKLEAAYHKADKAIQQIVDRHARNSGRSFVRQQSHRRTKTAQRRLPRANRRSAL